MEDTHKNYTPLFVGVGIGLFLGGIIALVVYVMTKSGNKKATQTALSEFEQTVRSAHNAEISLYQSKIDELQKQAE